MNPTTIRLGLLIAVLLPCPTQAADEDSPETRSYFLQLRAGAEYDSVVVLDELDLSNQSGDEAVLLDLAGGLTQTLGKDTRLDLRYNYSLLDYREFSEVDQQSHIFSADLKRDLGRAKLGLSTFHIDSTLGNDDLLGLTRVSPHLSGFFANGWFARAAYVYAHKTNEFNAGRDATTSIGELDIYHFPKGQKWYVNVGYKYRDEDADAARFDYSADTFKARWVQRLELAGLPARFELSYRHIRRDYSSITPSIGVERRDRRNRTRARLELTLSERLALELFYSYTDYESNLASVDFDQSVGGMRLRYRWES